MSPRNPAPISPFPLQGDRTVLVPFGSFATPYDGRVALALHQHPDFPSRNRYDVSCGSCGLLATYNAEAYGLDQTTKDGCDRAARDDAREHAMTHARTCVGKPAGQLPVTVPLSVHAAATLLFSSEVPVEVLNGADLRDVIAAEFARCGCNLARAEAEVAFEYGEHPETAAAHMCACIIAASRLAGVTV